MSNGTMPTGSSTRELRPFQPPRESDWWVNSILIAKTIAGAAECLPFPGVTSVFGTVVILLESVEKVNRNRDNLKELCGNVLEISTIVRDQITSHGVTAATKLKGPCQELESCLQNILNALHRLQNKPRGFRGHLREILRTNSNADIIARYQGRIQELRSNFLLMAAMDTNFHVHKILTEISPPLPVPAVIESVTISSCPLPSRNFQGRQTILNQMNKYFWNRSEQQHIFLLHGLGGAGKTQTALKFIEESGSKFSNMFMVDTSTIETIDAGLRNIAASTKSGTTAQAALKWLASKPDPWLLFFDNADDPQIDLNNFFPHCKHGNILITSRNPGLRIYAGSHFLVADMEETDSVELLLKSSSEEDTDGNREIALEIVKALCHLPLALIQAGAFISKTGDLNGYLQLYATNQAHLLSERPAQSHDNYAWTVYTTWQLSFRRLSRPAALLMRLCSFLHHEGIYEEIFSSASKYICSAGGPSAAEVELPREFLSLFLGPTGVWDSLRFIELTNEIRAYSLLNFDAKKKQFSIHPLVHNWSKTTLRTPQPYHCCMFSIMGMSIQQIPTKDMQISSLRLLPHINSLLQEDYYPRPDFRDQYGTAYYYAERTKEAKDIYVKILEDQKLVLGEDHSNTLLIMGNLASMHGKLGQLNEALQLEISVLEKRRKLLGDNHPDTLWAMGSLAWTYQKLGKFKEAEELQHAALERQRKILGDDHPNTLRAMGNLAAIYHRLGQLDSAERLEALLLRKRRHILGDEHPDTLLTMGNLASTYCMLGRWLEAEKLQVVVLAKRKQLLGEDHPDTVEAVKNLTSMYHALGKSQEADELGGSGGVITGNPERHI